MPATTPLTAITPTLTVDDMTASLDFYTRVLGLPLVARFDNDEGEPMGASVGFEGCQIFLGQDDWAKGRDRQKGLGFRFFLATPIDIDQLAAEIQERGGELDHDPTDREWGTRDFAITDPSGYKLSFTSPFEEGEPN